MRTAPEMRDAWTFQAVNTSVSGHHRMTLCGPGAFDTSLARHVLGWSPSSSWPTEG